jgi:hypothetical protein
MKIIFAIIFVLTLSMAAMTFASATGCRGHARNCEGYRGVGDKACAAALAECLKTCKFVGPGTGKVYVAVNNSGKGKCQPK